jgi:hypothetical protein
VTYGQKLLAVKRIRAWPRPERVFLTQLPEAEAEIIGQAVVELDLRPVPDEWVASPDALVIDIGRRS